MLEPWGGAAAFGDFLVAVEMGVIFAFAFASIYAPQSVTDGKKDSASSASSAAFVSPQALGQSTKPKAD